MQNHERESLDLILYKLTSMELGLKELEEKFNEMDERLEKIEIYLQRQKGFLGGILFIGSTLAWFASYIKDWLK